MINFFRKKRFDLMGENKTVKYLKYAIGEIVLVVIGILIALQVNSYNQNLQDRKLEHSLLIELQQSIKKDSLNIAWNVSNFERIAENAGYLDSVIRQKLPYEKKVDTAFGIISTFVITQSNYVPFDKIKSLKNGIIKNDSLYNALSAYYNFSRFLAEVDRYFENGAYFRKFIYPKYFNGYRYGAYAKVADYQKILESNEIKVAIDYCRNDAYYYYNQSKRREEAAGALMAALTEELKRFENDGVLW